ncbi:HAD domain-containing protein [Burkholderia glumae]|uniref:HAD domain-containing protein n=1 Tax=Burkholderia glumae TaxID=337 RepID=UPI00142F1861|nr:HAD domain-containing protein [Burkholderia glumae]
MHNTTKYKSMHNTRDKLSLFLDFDGVLHPAEEIVRFGRTNILGNARLFVWLPVLEHILKPYPEVDIIVSSSWRLKLDDQSLVRVLGDLGSRFVGVVDNWQESRADEIRAEVARRKLTKWLAVDDHPTVIVASRRDSRFIACHPDTGLGEQTVQAHLRAVLSEIYK